MRGVVARWIMKRRYICGAAEVKTYSIYLRYWTSTMDSEYNLVHKLKQDGILERLPSPHVGAWWGSVQNPTTDLLVSASFSNPSIFVRNDTVSDFRVFALTSRPKDSPQSSCRTSLVESSELQILPLADRRCNGSHQWKIDHH